MIAVLEGDGIGPEIMREGIKALRAVEEKRGYSSDLIYADFGAGAYFKHGDPFPARTRQLCDEADAVLKGPVGLSLVDMKKIPPQFGAEVGALLPLRKQLDTFANYRPVVLPKELADFSPLRPERIGDGLDILMIRELVGGIYFGENEEGPSTGMRYARDDCRYTREQVERFAHVCFREAQKKGGKLTNVHKKNILATSRFWDAVFEDVAKQYQDVKVTPMLVDNVAYQLSVNPTQFNGVMAMENLQGDILTDQAGGILGSLGLMPSACLNPDTGRGYYEPAHGSAPDIAGKNIANPYSMIGSVAFMLSKSFGMEGESNEIWAALAGVFARGYRTMELARGTPDERIVSTSQFGDLVKQGILSD